MYFVSLLFSFHRVCPIFQISNVSGENLPLLKMFLNLLSTRVTCDITEPAEFQIDETYSVPVSLKMSTLWHQKGAAGSNLYFAQKASKFGISGDFLGISIVDDFVIIVKETIISYMNISIFLFGPTAPVCSDGVRIPTVVLKSTNTSNSSRTNLEILVLK